MQVKKNPASSKERPTVLQLKFTEIGPAVDCEKNVPVRKNPTFY